MSREEKKAQFDQPRKLGYFPWVLVAIVLVVVGAGAWYVLGGRSGPAKVHAVEIQAMEGQVSIPLEKVSDGRAHFFTYRSGGTDIRFFVMKSADGVFRAALDTCDVCYKHDKGYRQEGNFMICNACDMKFDSNRINDVQGGCNPAPLSRTVAGNELFIAEAELARSAWYFQGGSK